MTNDDRGPKNLDAHANWGHHSSHFHTFASVDSTRNLLSVYNLQFANKLKSTIFSQNLPKIYSFATKCQKCTSQV